MAAGDVVLVLIVVGLLAVVLWAVLKYVRRQGAPALGGFFRRRERRATEARELPQDRLPGEPPPEERPREERAR